MATATATATATETKRQWCDMPRELLSQVAEHLDLIGLLRFRAVCKDFLRASSYNTSSTAAKKAVAEMGSQIPWFLVYGETYCSLLTSSNERYTNLSIKELQGATVLASSEGWLLVFKQGSVFFLCPFSGARIDLPNLPYSELTNHVAAFSYTPKITQCTVVITSRSADDYLHVNMIDRTSWHWTTREFRRHREDLDTIKAAFSSEGEKFYFLGDPKDGLIKYFMLNNNGQTGREVADGVFVIVGDNNNNNDVAPAVREMPKGPSGIKEWIKGEIRCIPIGYSLFNAAKDLRVKEMLCLDEDVGLSTCGTLVRYTMLYNESTSQLHHANGVWIQPRFHQISTPQDLWDISQIYDALQ